MLSQPELDAVRYYPVLGGSESGQMENSSKRILHSFDEVHGPFIHYEE